MNSKTLTLALALVMSGCAPHAPIQVAQVAPVAPVSPPPCVATFFEMASHLKKKYGEVAQVSGIDATGRLLVIHVNPDTGTWTITVSRPNGLTCVVSAGTALDMPVLQGEPS